MQLTQTSVPLAELQNRMDRFRARMAATRPDWQLAIVFTKVNLYYFIGTMPDGMLVIPRNDQAVLWVRRSYERALDESLFPQIRPMDGFRDAAASMKNIPNTVFLETETVPLALFQRLQKYFPFANVQSLNPQIAAVRALKSPYELTLMEKAGEIHRRALEERVPALLREGMSEADLGATLFAWMIAEGHHGVARFAMFDTETVLGYVSFGESSLYPISSNGTGGNRGLSPAVPLLGSRQRKLKKGDLVYIDIACGVDGYHTDKTITYIFDEMAPAAAVEAQAKCVQIQTRSLRCSNPAQSLPRSIKPSCRGWSRTFSGTS
jgi:Xaa-Pro aminopeptidase